MIHHEHLTFDILDIGSTLTNPATLQTELYTLGLTYQPTAFLDEAPFPYAERRAGVLWIENQGFTRFATKVQDRILSDPTYGAALAASLDAHTSAAQRALEQPNLAQLWNDLARLMGFTAFNWLIPHDHITERIMELTGMSHDEAERWRLRVSAPAVMPHFLAFRLAFLDLITQLQTGHAAAVAAFAEEYGPLEGQGLISQLTTCSLDRRSPYEDSQHVLAEAQTAAATSTPAQVQAERKTILSQRQTVLRLREEAIGVSHLKAQLRNQDGAIAESIATVLQAAATAEEVRHVLQIRAEARLRDHLLAHGKPIASTAAAEIGLPMPPHVPPSLPLTTGRSPVGRTS